MGDTFQAVIKLGPSGEVVDAVLVVNLSDSEAAPQVENERRSPTYDNIHQVVAWLIDQPEWEMIQRIIDHHNREYLELDAIINRRF